MRKYWIAVLGLALALGLLAGSSAAAEGPSPSTEATPGAFGCNTGHACVWPSAFFTGTIGESLCTGGVHTLAGAKLSGVNECTNSNKAVFFRSNGSTIKCLNAGETDGNFGFSINELFVGAENSHC